MTESTGSSRPDSGGSHPGKPRGSPVYSVDAEDVIDVIERAKAHPDEDKFHEGILPMLDLPSFGEPDDNCGDPCPGSLYFCPSCTTIHEKPHVCYRYDCPLHWAHAVRRRAAGSQSGAGVAPQLDALRRYLNAYRDDDNQYFHHLVVSLGKDRRLAAADPLERDLETVREIMDEIGIQGLVGYHPWSGENEDHDGDDRGEWKDRIGKDTEWDGVRDELEHRPHFHIVGVAPFVDFSETPKIEDETGAVLHRITQEDSNVSIEDDQAMCRAATYVLSHCGIYETDTGQRRLAAWMKGPDVDRIAPLEKHKSRIQKIVHAIGTDTLGIDPPNLECDAELDAQEERADETEPPDVDLGNSDPILDVWDTGDEGESRIGDRSTGNTITVAQPSGPSNPTTPSGHSLSASTDLPPSRDHFDSWSGSSSSTSSTGSSTAPPEKRADGDVDEDAETCGSRLRHISQAGEFLLDDDWNENHDDEAVRDVETAYQSYVNWMEAQGHEPHDDPLVLPEERAKPPPGD